MSCLLHRDSSRDTLKDDTVLSFSPPGLVVLMIRSFDTFVRLIGRTLFICSFLPLQFYLLIVYILIPFNYEYGVVPTSGFTFQA